MCRGGKRRGLYVLGRSSTKILWAFAAAPHRPVSSMRASKFRWLWVGPRPAISFVNGEWKAISLLLSLVVSLKSLE